jgi:site-specific recombinase XerD
VLDYIYALKTFSNWLFLKKEKKTLTATSFDIEKYFNYLKEQGYKNNYIRPHYHYLNRYYRWLLYKGHIKINPTPDLKISRDKVKINILDEHTVKKLYSFIRNKNSNPEQALMILLTLIWGTRTIDLAHAQLLVRGNTFDIKFRRRELTKGKKYYNRPEILKFPEGVPWLKVLQKRYLESWQAHYAKIKKSYPASPLFLHCSCHNINFLSTEIIAKRFKKACAAAAKVEITNKIVRQTCGHQASLSGDASILSTLGWSDQFAFHYTWLPREIWTK